MKNEKPSIRVRLEAKKSGAKPRADVFVAVNARAYTGDAVASASVGQIETFASQLYAFERSLAGEVVLEAEGLEIRVNAKDTVGHVEVRLSVKQLDDILQTRFETDPISVARFADGLLAGLRDSRRIALLDGF
ncbi:MAG: hypothetical protein ACKVU1_10395 [bacterium]